MAGRYHQRRNGDFEMGLDDYFHAQHTDGNARGQIVPMVLERIKLMASRCSDDVDTLLDTLEHDGLPVIRLTGWRGALLTRALATIGLNHALLLPNTITQDSHTWRYPMALSLCRASGLLDKHLGTDNGVLVIQQPSVYSVVIHATHWMNARLGLPGYQYNQQRALNRYLQWQQAGTVMKTLARQPASTLQALMPALQRHTEALSVLATICEEVLGAEEDARQQLGHNKPKP